MAGTIVYIDGLNFHAGAVRGTPEAKWVDFEELSRRLLPAGDTLVRVKYFTAPVSAQVAEDPGSVRRHNYLLRAIDANPLVEVHKGKFIAPNEWRSIAVDRRWADRTRPASWPALGKLLDRKQSKSRAQRRWKVRVQLPQEKHTDVALASHLLADLLSPSPPCAQAILVSNDSDLMPAVKMAVSLGNVVGVVSPMAVVAKDLEKVASWSWPMRRELPGQCQMPDIVPLKKGHVERPKAWK
ncbi:MAG: NYN domain-containing protein [Acidimicrobiales bacterium]